jgi:hypothetical protein
VLLLTGTLPTPPVPPGMPAGAAANIPTHQEIWVDPSSWLPLRSQYLNATNTVVQQIDYEWLPRTVANLGRLVLTVPAGFRRVTVGGSSGPTAPPVGTTV